MGGEGSLCFEKTRARQEFGNKIFFMGGLIVTGKQGLNRSSTIMRESFFVNTILLKGALPYCDIGAIFVI